MFKILWVVPAVMVSFLWSLFFPVKPQPAPVAPPPAPDPGAPSEESQAAGHEVTDAKAKTMVMLVALLFTVILVAMLALGRMYAHLYTADPAMPVTTLQANFQHGPRARTSIAKDWEILNAQAGARLGDYGWVDRAQGTVHIPIARAMELVGKEGLPARAGRAPAFPAPDQEKLPLTELENNVNANSYDPSR